ncbi:TVP38/TMEM64 family protein, partial [Deinococcus sp. MIMF12]|nr:TVP38/TMEM64 family protein [Deinococcus rhizophilus]
MTSAPLPPRRAAVAALRWIVPGVVVLALGALALTPDARAFLGEGWEALTSSDPAVTRAFVEDLGPAGPLALLAGFVLQAAVPVLPALVMTAVTARAYGPVEGFLLVYLGTLLGAAAGYGLGRALGDTLVRA